jgi:hypothetical protein
MSPMIPAQTLELKWNWYTNLLIAWWLSLLWALNTPSRLKYASSIHRTLCKKSLPTVCWCHSYSQNCIVEDDFLETDVRSTGSDVDATEGHEVLRRPSVGIVPILIQYRVTLSMTFVPQLPLWHLHLFVCVQSMGDLHSCVLYMLYFLAHTGVALIVETH